MVPIRCFGTRISKCLLHADSDPADGIVRNLSQGPWFGDLDLRGHCAGRFINRNDSVLADYRRYDWNCLHDRVPVGFSPSPGAFVDYNGYPGDPLCYSRWRAANVFFGSTCIASRRALRCHHRMDLLSRYYEATAAERRNSVTTAEGRGHGFESIRAAERRNIISPLKGLGPATNIPTAFSPWLRYGRRYVAKCASRKFFSPSRVSRHTQANRAFSYD